MKFWYRVLAATAAMMPLHPVGAQTPTHVLRGQVSSAHGAPLAGANVFLLESLAEAVSDADGRFALETTARGRVTVVARHVGYAPANVVVPVDTTGGIMLTLRTQAVVLVPIRVQAGAYTAG